MFGRLTDAGCKVDDSDACESGCDEELMGTPEGWEWELILDLFFGLAQPSRRNKYVRLCEYFRESLKIVALVTDKHEYNINAAANSGIVARLASFKAEP